MKICLTCEGVLDRDEASCAHCGGPLLDARSVAMPVRRGDDEAHGPLVGRVVDGKYRVVGVLGRGGMGVVYRAIHEVSLIPVALKVLHPRWSMRPDFRGWFLAEARKAGRVLHEGSARVLDVGAAIDGTVYLAVELVEGQTLGEWLATHDPVDPALVVDLCEQVARAMAAAHAAGVVHRDLSPRNVMVAVRDGRLVTKVLDFGIAIGAPMPAIRTEGLHHQLDLAPTGFANPPYSAPEHLAGRDVDPRADIYSLGVILYEALSGELPVAGSTSRELARATLEGRIRPLRPRAPVPRALVRLVESMTDPDPDRRPSSATAVAEQLHRLLEPGRRVLMTISIIALAFAVIALVLPLFRDPSSIYLRARPDGLILSQLVDPPALLDVQSLRSVSLLATRFDFGGLSPEQLSLHVSREFKLLFDTPLRDLLVQDGEVLRFGTSAVALAWRVREACVSGPVELSFEHSTIGPLAYAHVLVDDDSPVVDLHREREGEPSSALRGADQLEIAIDDAGGVARAWLEIDLLRTGSGPKGHEQIAIAPQSARRSALELLGSVLGDVRGFGACELRVAAVDRAGNEARSDAIAYSTLDLAVPEIVEVGPPGGGEVFVQDGRGVALRVRSSAPEPGVELSAQAPGTTNWTPVAISAVGGDAGERLDLFLPVPEDGRLVPSGRWRFRLRDPVGNVSSDYEEDLEIRSADPRPELRPCARREGTGLGITEFAGGFVADGGPWRLALRVDPLYRPRRCVVTRADGAAVESWLEHVQPGGAEIVVGRIESGDWQLCADVVDSRNGAVLSLPPRQVRVLDARIELRIPACGDAIFLGQLAQRAILDPRNDRVSQGAGWQLMPNDARLVQGRVWTRLGDTLVAREIPLGETATQPILPSLPIGRGWHEISLALDDVLGRPLQIVVGDHAAEPVVLANGASAVKVARFFAHDAPVHATQAAAPFEFGQALRLSFAVDLPAVKEFAWRLSIRDAVFAPLRVAEDHNQVMLHFALPFEIAAAATDLDGLEARDFALGRDSRTNVRILTPAGDFDVVATVRTIRTTLHAVVLGDLRDDLPPEIRTIRLVPIPGPGVGGVFADPVPEGVDGRVRFRASAPVGVRNLPDICLQDRELTRAQYLAIVRHGLRAAEKLTPERRQLLWIPGDPRGETRLSVAALRPYGEPLDGAELIDGERAVSGVDFYQANTVAKLLGLLLVDDPEFLRLPLGVELELAAFGATERAEVVLNGSAVRGPGIDLGAMRDEHIDMRPSTWPPNAARCMELGDQVVTDLGDVVSGLDCGVREWVLDLPVSDVAARGRAVVDEWRADYVRHLERALRRDRSVAELDPVTASRAVLRGTAAGEEASQPAPDGRAGRGWIGVVRELQIRRDGTGLVPGSIDPYLQLAGFRVVGGERFVAEVRRR